jgi:hypothetical protein
VQPEGKQKGKQYLNGIFGRGDREKVNIKKVCFLNPTFSTKYRKALPRDEKS